MIKYESVFFVLSLFKFLWMVFYCAIRTRLEHADEVSTYGLAI